MIKNQGQFQENTSDINKSIVNAIDDGMMDATGYFIFKILLSVIPWFIAYQIKDNAYNNLCGKLLVYLASSLPERQGNIL